TVKRRLAALRKEPWPDFESARRPLDVAALESLETERRMLRAMWKGVLLVGDERVAVKLYSAVEDRSVHFRMLHATDRVPVQQRLVEPESDTVVEYAAAQRAYLTPERELVMLRSEELDA